MYMLLPEKSNTHYCVVFVDMRGESDKVTVC